MFGVILDWLQSKVEYKMKNTLIFIFSFFKKVVFALIYLAKWLEQISSLLYDQNMDDMASPYKWS